MTVGTDRGKQGAAITLRHDGTTVVRCDCAACGGLSARVRGDGRMSATRVHNMVRLAHSPLSRAVSVQQSGPWAA